MHSLRLWHGGGVVMVEREDSVSILKADIDALEKMSGRQPTDYLSMVSKLSRSQSLYDFSLSLSPFQSSQFILSATPTSGEVSAIRMKFYYSWDAPDVMNNAYQHTNMPGVSLYSLSLPSQGATLRWGFNAEADEWSHTLYVKVQFVSSDEVVWSFS